jgi:hypothetical protein
MGHEYCKKHKLENRRTFFFLLGNEDNRIIVHIQLLINLYFLCHYSNMENNIYVDGTSWHKYLDSTVTKMVTVYLFQLKSLGRANK